MNINLKEFINQSIKDILKDGVHECVLDGASYSMIEDILCEMGYQLSDNSDCVEEVMYTNGWEHDYYQYIFQNGIYTGYYLFGSLYYGNHRIEKDEIN